MDKTSKAMDSTYEIVCYQPEFKGQVVELQTHSWSPSVALNTAYLEWKYERNPYLDEPLIYLAMHNGRAVGMRGFLGVEWEGGIPNQKFPSLYADDMVIAPKHRNRGLIPKIMAAAFEDLGSRGYQYVFNLSAGPVTFISSLSMGWRSAGSMQPMRRQPWRVAFQWGLHRIIKRLPLISHKIEGLFSQWSEKARRSLADMDRERVKHTFKAVPRISLEDMPRCTAMAELVERIGSRGRIRHVRDLKYFEWRFQNPLGRYRFLFWEKARLEGYLVLQEYTSEFHDKEVVNIVDWEATSTAVQVKLLQAALNYVSNRNLIIWSATLPRETTVVLKENGFELERQSQGLAQDRPQHVLVRSIRDEELDGDWMLVGRRLLDMKNWDLRMLYSMRG